MKKSVCLYFQVHQPTRLRLYRFFDIGKDSHYYDDFANRTILKRIAQKCYLPMNELLLDAIKCNKGKFKLAFSISGSALEQFDRYAPEVIDSFRKLADTGCVEFLCETYNHSLASLASRQEFEHQVNKHKEAIEHYFGVTPKTFRNTELIYSDSIGKDVYDLGFKTILTEGARHIMGWQSPNYLYRNDIKSGLKVLLRNYSLSDDIAFRFSNQGWCEYPLTADKFINWINGLPQEEQIVNLFMNYETLGELQPRESGIFEFLKAIPRFAFENDVNFITPSEAISKLKPVAQLSVPTPMSWADEARDTSAWLGNNLQNEAFHKLYSIAERVRLCEDRKLKQDWYYLQASDHFYYMCTKHFNDGSVHSHYSPYDTPFAAFTNYMNVLSDFIVRVEEQYPLSIENEELNALLTTIRNQSQEISELNKEVDMLRNNLIHEDKEEKEAAKPKAPAKKKPAAKKTDK